MIGTRMQLQLGSDSSAGTWFAAGLFTMFVAITGLPDREERVGVIPSEHGISIGTPHQTMIPDLEVKKEP